MNDEPQPQSNKNIIFLVILTMACCTIIGVLTFAYCMIWRDTASSVTPFASIVTACLGYLAGVLSKTSPTEMTKHVDVTNAPTITDATNTTPTTPPAV
jgi:hypothetical protein